MRELARQLRNALLPQPRGDTRSGRAQRSRDPTAAPRAEWPCHCGCSNWVDRRACRECRAPRWPTPPPPPPQQPASTVTDPTYAFPPHPPASTVRPGPPAPQPDATAPPATTTLPPKQHAAALQHALAAAEAACAPESVLIGLREAALDAGRARADARPLGARLDSARAQVARTTARCEAAARAEQAAADAHRAALEAKREAEALLASLETEVADHTRCASTLADGTRELLDALECSLGALSPSGPAERILSCMKSLHDILGTGDAQPEPRDPAGVPCASARDADNDDDNMSERSTAPRRTAESELGEAEISDDMSDAEIARRVRAMRLRRRTGPA